MAHCFRRLDIRRNCGFLHGKSPKEIIPLSSVSKGRTSLVSGEASKVGNELRRPKVLGLVAIMGFLYSLLLAPLPVAWHYGFAHALRMLVSSLLGMVCMYGFWKMWRWSVYAYAGLWVFDALHYWVLLRHRTGPPAVEAVFAVCGLIYLRRMQ